MQGTVLSLWLNGYFDNETLNFSIEKHSKVRFGWKQRSLLKDKKPSQVINKYVRIYTSFYVFRESFIRDEYGSRLTKENNILMIRLNNNTIEKNKHFEGALCCCVGSNRLSIARYCNVKKKHICWNPTGAEMPNSISLWFFVLAQQFSFKNMLKSYVSH